MNTSALTDLRIRWRRPLVATAGVVVTAIGLSLIPLRVSEARDDGCSNATLSGAYGFKGSGSVVLPTGDADVAVVGRTVFDGRGGLSGSDTNSLNGTITRETTTGTYHVNKDCTGSETFTGSSGNKVNADFVIVDNGRQAFFVETDPGVVLTVVAERQLSSGGPN